MTLSLDGTSGITNFDNSIVLSEAQTAAVWSGRNMILNGDMSIDQENAGAASVITTTSYSVDGFFFAPSQSSIITTQQNGGSYTPPVGFNNYLQAKVTTAATLGSTDYFAIESPIEGVDIVRLGWGTANAQDATLSFWVRSTVTGTFGGAISNGGTTVSYPFTYVINTANTWEYKTVTIPATTSGTWATDNTVGMYVILGLGVGSTYSGAEGSWAAAQYISATTATSIVGTLDADLCITGVQLEVGTQATTFEHLPYQQRLARCQRYYETDADTHSLSWSGYTTSTTTYYANLLFSVEKRAVPTISLGTINGVGFGTAALSVASIRAFQVYATSNSAQNGGYYQLPWIADARL